ncbi:Cysteine desulfurase [Lentibacillus sp. JNUCC-1]|uniref:cysteine desulfurase family protein n=1 Tax=Lentibacillus sp. JNUCC-1 TaxID=2654513 RepID=UPI0012E9418B|nr:cysteine desulfurase family protein [Lentibacillus sp. JNUCC-1]MUV39538.1 Cysteine desulfurase [Lentibacillus sp. JNUCC-1]
MNSIYLDHAATTPIDPQVLSVMNTVQADVFGNPSSIHSFGRQARFHLDEARHTMAQTINAQDKEIIFTSGGTEADNLALIGTALANEHKGRHIITTAIEHHATLHTAEYLEKNGFEVTYLPVDEQGLVHLDEVDKALRADTILVSVMYVNNETGVIQPVKEIASMLVDHQAFFHTDAVQAFGLIDIDVKKDGIDLLSVSAHKINGPKGIGFLYAGEDVLLETLQHGGEQERKHRGGTENMGGVAGFKTAVEIMGNTKRARSDLYEGYKTLFLEVLEEENIPFRLNGSVKTTVPTILNISFPGTQVESVLINLDLEGVAASSGSACTAGSVEPSHVLSAMYGSDDSRTTNSIRFSFGFANHEKNVADAARRTAKVMHRLMKKGGAGS